MVEESDIVGFLKDHKGQASLEELSEGLGILKYGPNSAYALLQSLRSKRIVERRGEMWVLLAPEAAICEKVPPPPEKRKPEAAPEIERVMKAMAKEKAVHHLEGFKPAGGRYGSLAR